MPAETYNLSNISGPNERHKGHQYLLLLRTIQVCLLQVNCCSKRKKNMCQRNSAAPGF